MTNFEVHFRSDAEFASKTIAAKTPKQALARARKLHEDNPSSLWFEPYDGMPVNEIAVCDKHDKEVAVWLDDDLRLGRAARELLEAAEAVIARWESGDLAEAVRNLTIAVAKAREGAG